MLLGGRHSRRVLEVARNHSEQMSAVELVLVYSFWCVAPDPADGLTLSSISIITLTHTMRFLHFAHPALKFPAIPSNGQFRKDTKIGHFLKFFKGGTKGKSLKK